MTEPEQWAVELVYDLGVPFGSRNHAALTIQRAFEERENELRHTMRNIVSHATMGSTTGEGMGINAICVEITRQRNKLYQAGKDAALATRQDAPKACSEGTSHDH